MYLFWLFWCFAVFAETRELIIQRACAVNPELSFCRPHTTASEIRSEIEKKHDVFLKWAYVAAKDAEDIEHVDTEELETSHKEALSVEDYCKKYRNQFQSYCRNGNLEKLEGLLAQFCGSYARNCDVSKSLGGFPTPRPNLQSSESFPTPQPTLQSSKSSESSESFPTPQPSLESSKSSEDYCSSNHQKYKDECLKEGFQPETFCGEFSKKCPKVEEVKEEKKEEDSLETPEEFEKHTEEEEENKVEGQGSGTTSDEVTAYCTNYIENYNFYCVGDMAPEHAKFCESYRKNCPDRVSLKQSGSFLGSEGGGGEEAEVSEGSDKTYLYKGSKREYCQKFSVNYEYYCKGTIENVEIFTKFCPSYKKACISGAPSSPFISRVSQKQAPKTSSKGTTSDFPDLDHPDTKKSKSRGRSRKVKRRACTADCDERFFPHCTTECKCDYAYPAVQKFCNPPPLPLFLNTCRLWYYGCPKYERYHYASQFIYSKAEKGKVLEGPKTQTTFNLLSPSGEALPYRPARRYKRDVEDMVEWVEGSGEMQLDREVEEEEVLTSSGLKKKTEENGVGAKTSESRKEDVAVQNPREENPEVIVVGSKTSESQKGDVTLENPRKENSRDNVIWTTNLRASEPKNEDVKLVEPEIHVNRTKNAAPESGIGDVTLQNPGEENSEGNIIWTNNGAPESGKVVVKSLEPEGHVIWTTNNHASELRKEDVTSQNPEVDVINTPNNRTSKLQAEDLTSQKPKNETTTTSEAQEIPQTKIIKTSNGTLIHLVAAPPLPPKGSSRDQVLSDKPPANPFQSKPPELPRIKKTTGGEAVPVYSDSVFSNALQQYNSLTDSRGILHRPRSRSPFTKPGLWEPNPDDPHNRDHANKYYYRPYSVSVDWLQGQLAWGAHWAVPAAGVGGTDGFSAVHFPSIGTFLNIPDDYD